MKAPDKVYITREKNGVVYSLSFNDNGGFEFIRKGALLEWAKELKGQVCALHPNNRDATCARDGMLTIIDNIFDKLNSL